MACKFICFEWDARPESEWIPMGLRDARCLLRSSDPRRWNRELRFLGVPVEASDVDCLHNLTASWSRCPLAGGANRRRNEFGYPLQL